MRRPKHEHEWEWYSTEEVHIYDSAWGAFSSKPTRVETHVSGQCKTCGEPRMERIPGVYKLPTTETTP